MKKVANVKELIQRLKEKHIKILYGTEKKEIIKLREDYQHIVTNLWA